MRLIYLTLVAGLLCSACDRNETAAPAARPVAPAGTATVQDLSSVDTKVTIVPVRPVFVRTVDLVQDGKAVPEGSSTLKKSQRVELVVGLQQAPGGLGLRYELVDGSGKTVIEERRLLESRATEARYLLALQTVPAGQYELRLWSGADLAEARRVTVE